MRAELIGHFKPCMTDIYLYIYARMADYIRTHPYVPVRSGSHALLVCDRLHPSRILEV